MDDGFADYRKFCANRMRRLERYKKAKSFCNVENENSGCFKQSASITSLLINFKISLMENDVRLLQQLLALGESIQELKSKNQTSSRVSLNSFDDEENEDIRPLSNASPFSSSFSAITHLYVNDEYFSRKNSVLRIPIPPRSTNRMSANRRIMLAEPSVFITTDVSSRRSNGSIDSGIRDSSPSSGSISPTFKTNHS
ncbi:unnamed protein product [Dracunculus medinensis]|uniref:Uncharacterized protein n=1 Tax=Dracunculus medinensis TaxID=318479 RepID=A0A158Q534_DRAME|nr:unnamed protein product [Dracunculus medinensis]